MQVRLCVNLRWSEPVNASATGECYGMSYGNQEYG